MAVLPYDTTGLGLQACRDLVAEVYTRAEGLGAKPPLVTDGRGRRHACGSREVIKLPRWARTKPVVLHECAHGLSSDGHGPGFVKVYVELLIRHAGFDRLTLLTSLKAAGVRYAVTDEDSRGARRGPARSPRAAKLSGGEGA